MLKFPLTIAKEEDLTLSMLRELAVYYVGNLVKPEGDFLDAQFEFEGEILVTLHKGKISKGSKASVGVCKKHVWVKIQEE